MLQPTAWPSTLDDLAQNLNDNFSLPPFAYPMPPFANITESNAYLSQAKFALEKKFVCPVCGLRYKYKYDLQRHIGIHDSKKYPCPICNKDFSLPKYVQHHMLAVHQMKSMSAQKIRELATDDNPVWMPWCKCIEAKIKWLPFCRQHFHIPFQMATGLISNKLSLVKSMAWHWTEQTVI